MELQIMNKETGESVVPAGLRKAEFKCTEAVPYRADLREPAAIVLGKDDVLVRKGNTFFMHVIDYRWVTAQPEKFSEPSNFLQIIGYGGTDKNKKFTPVTFTINSFAAERLFSCISLIMAAELEEDQVLASYVLEVVLGNQASTNKGKTYGTVSCSYYLASEADMTKLVQAFEHNPAMAVTFPELQNTTSYTDSEGITHEA